MKIRLTDKVHEVLKHLFEMRVARNRNRDIDSRAHGGPDEARHALCPAPAQDLDGQADRVDVGAVVGDDAQCENDQAELAEATEGPEEDGAEKTSSARGCVAVCVLVLAAVEGGGGHDGNTQHLGEEQGDDEADPDGKEDLCPRLGARLVHSVVCCVAGPSCCEAVDYTAEAEHATHLTGTHTHGDVDKGS